MGDQASSPTTEDVFTDCPCRRRMHGTTIAMAKKSVQSSREPPRAESSSPDVTAQFHFRRFIVARLLFQEGERATLAEGEESPKQYEVQVGMNLTVGMS